MTDMTIAQTNCVDNGPREGLQTFLEAASDDPDTVLHYEFMQVRCPVHNSKFPRLMQFGLCVSKPT